MQCPFPDCQSESESSKPLSDGVYCCIQCGRLAARCLSSECRALNRPFARYCRHCRRFQGNEAFPAPGRERWDEFARFDDDWRFNSAADVPAAEIVADLQDEGHSNVASERLMALAWVDGLLAIHQSGGFVALAHPFGDTAKRHGSPAVFWSAAEREWLSSPSGAGRPYRPAATADRRYILFATTHGCFVVDLFSLPGWAAHHEPHAFRVLGDSELRGGTLAAAPVFFNSSPSEGVSPAVHRCGFLTASPEGYRWQVRKVVDNGTDTTATIDVPLPIEGRPAQILVADQTAIIFATAHGHWWWTWEAAERGDITGLHRSWPPAEKTAGELALDREVEAEAEGERRFRWQKQYVISPSLRSGRRTATLELCYAREHGDRVGELAEFYQIQFSPPGYNYPTALETSGHLKPIGEDRGEMLFLGNTKEHRSAMLWRKVQGDNHVSPRQGIIADNILDVVGVQLHGPLLLMLSPETSKRVRQVQLRAVAIRTQPHYTVVTVPGLQLLADPVSCAEYVFTIERQEERIRLIRRRLPIVDAGKRV